MKKQIISLLILLSFSSSHTYSSEHFWKPAKDGDKIILIRHALAPGGGDPEGFNIKDCRTQRNLNEIGINQSKNCLLYTSPSPRDNRVSRMPSSA